jgi:hypothetical protein
MLGYDLVQAQGLHGGRIGVEPRAIDDGDGLAEPMPGRRRPLGRFVSTRERMERSHRVEVIAQWQNNRPFRHRQHRMAAVSVAGTARKVAAGDVDPNPVPCDEGVQNVAQIRHAHRQY